MTDSFTTHCFIEFYYNTDKGFLTEHNSSYTFKHLNESYGVFDGCRDIAENISDDLVKYLGKRVTTAISKQIDNSWIKTLNLYLYNSDRENVGASYVPSLSKIINNIGFQPLTIRINLHNKTRREIILALMHELTHAYEDYNRFVKGKPSIDDESKRLGYYLNDVGNYNDYKLHLSYLLYYITSFERNAFMSQLKGELETCDKHFFEIRDIVNFLKQTKVYRDFQTIMSYIGFFESITDTNSQNTILRWVADTSNLEYNTYNQFVKYIVQKGYEIERKINTFIPKIAYEYLQFGNVFNNNNDILPKI